MFVACSTKHSVVLILGGCIALSVLTFRASNHYFIPSGNLYEEHEVPGYVKETTSNATDYSTDPSVTTNGYLHRNWTYNPPWSKYALLIEQSQSNCSMAEALFHVDNSFGLGSHIGLWSQAICNGWEAGAKVRTVNPEWLWLDQEHCDLEQARTKSPLLCYFPTSEANECPSDGNSTVFNVTDPRNKRTWCTFLRPQNDTMTREFRAASTEYLFRRVSPLVIREAQRQAQILFPGGIAPPDLITVHIRWGDKFWEMDLASIQEYIDAISTLLIQRQGHNDTANIYLATEDPKAVEEFQQAIPTNWTTFVDVTVSELNEFRPSRGNRASHATKNTKGRAGLVAMGSLLIAMEANDFVLTTKSNWSRLMDQLRTQMLEAKCKDEKPCTHVVDLRPGVW